MNYILEILIFIIGCITGSALGYFFFKNQSKGLKHVFKEMSFDALKQSNEEFLKLAALRLETEREKSKGDLDTKKELIDQSLGKMQKEFEKITGVISEFEKDRIKKYGELSENLRAVGLQTNKLCETTDSLQQALSNSRVRGQWGQRMAEDVLRFAGFIEDINYVKEKVLQSSGTKPDFTFFMPHDMKVNMDVKFPIENYLKYLDEKSGTDRENFKKAFLKDVRDRLKEVTSREYINPAEHTVDYVLMFIPNEQVYTFIHEEDHSILDDALSSKVILCSPITLFAVLAIMRQAVDNFSLEETSNEILSLLGSFKKQWGNFINKFDSLGSKIYSAVEEYEKLLSTRKNMLEKPLNRIESLRQQKALPVLEDNEPSEDNE